MMLAAETDKLAKQLHRYLQNKPSDAVSVSILQREYPSPPRVFWGALDSLSGEGLIEVLDSIEPAKIRLAREPQVAPRPNSDDRRAKILAALTEKPGQSGAMLAHAIGCSQPQASKLLREMLDARQVIKKGAGNIVKFYPAPQSEATTPAIEHASPQSGNRPSRPDYRAHAETLVDLSIDLIRQVLVKQMASVLEEFHGELIASRSTTSSPR